MTRRRATASLRPRKSARSHVARTSEHPREHRFSVDTLDALRSRPLALAPQDVEGAPDEARHASSGVWAKGSSDLATYAVHDAKNVACALRANSEWLRGVCEMELPRPDVLEALGEMMEGCEQLVDLMHETLMVHRAMSFRVEPTPVHLATLVGCAADRVRRRAESAGVRVVVEGPEALAALLDRALFSRLLDNLLDNALRVSRADDEVRVCHGQIGRNVVVSVTDQGPGVPPAQRARIFELFARGSGGGRDSTGVGLAFCRVVAEAHGGNVCVEDAPGRGASFVVTVPLSDRQDDGGPPDSDPHRGGGS